MQAVREDPLSERERVELQAVIADALEEEGHEVIWQGKRLVVNEKLIVLISRLQQKGKKS